MAPLEKLRFEPLGDVVLASVRGEVDLSNALSVKRELLDAVPNTASALVLDLSETEHLDSSGVRLIFELAERLERRGQKLELVVPDGFKHEQQSSAGCSSGGGGGRLVIHVDNVPFLCPGSIVVGHS